MIHMALLIVLALIVPAPTARAAHCGPMLLPIVMKSQELVRELKEAMAEGDKRRTCAAARKHFRNNQAVMTAFKRLPKHCIHDASVPMAEREAAEQAEVQAIIRENCPAAPARKPAKAAAKAPAEPASK